MEPVPPTVMGFLNDFQTGIVGIIGFIGVIWTLRSNEKIAHRQAIESRHHDQQVLARALRAELRSHHTSLERNISIFREDDEDQRGNLLIPPFSTPVFDANISNLGLLSHEQLDIALSAFLEVKEADRVISLSSETNNAAPYRSIPASKAPRLAKIYEDLRCKIEEALEKLER